MLILVAVAVLYGSLQTSAAARAAEEATTLAEQMNEVQHAVYAQQLAIEQFQRSPLASTRARLQELDLEVLATVQALRSDAGDTGGVGSERIEEVLADQQSWRGASVDVVHAVQAQDPRLAEITATRLAPSFAALHYGVASGTDTAQAAAQTSLTHLRTTQQRVLVLISIALAVALLLLGLILRQLFRFQHSLLVETAASAHQAAHDALTGLANRVLLARRLEQALEGRGPDHLAAVLAIDLDRFKDVNDSLGHHAGDVLLCQVAERLKAAVRQADTVARTGGDEFVIVMPVCSDVAAVHAVASRILTELERPFTLPGDVVAISGSIGIATLSPGPDDESAADVLRRADRAMYRAKVQRCGYVTDAAPAAA